MLTIMGVAISISNIDCEFANRLRCDSCFYSTYTSFNGFLNKFFAQQNMQTKAQIIEIIKQAANDTPTAIPITLLLLYGADV